MGQASSPLPSPPYAPSHLTTLLLPRPYIYIPNIYRSSPSTTVYILSQLTLDLHASLIVSPLLSSICLDPSSISSSLHPSLPLSFSLLLTAILGFHEPQGDIALIAQSCTRQQIICKKCIDQKVLLYRTAGQVTAHEELCNVCICMYVRTWCNH